MLKANILDHFTNLLEYQQWVHTSIASVSYLNTSQLKKFDREQVERTIRIQPDWYGKGANFEEMKKGITEYLRPGLIEKIQNQVSAKITADTRDKIKAKKVKFNPNGLGVFVFDRAAMGMYRLKEFYSPGMDKVVEREEVKKVKNEFRLLADNSLVIERWEEKEGKPKIRTTNKNVYAYYEKVNKEKHAVDLLVSCGASSSITAEQCLYSGMGALIVAQILEQGNIPTRISIAIGSSPDGYSHSAYACLIPVKNYDERLDTNLLALLTSDPRFFRYEGFQGIVSLYDHFKESAPESLGRGMNREFLIKTIEQSSYTKQNKLAPNRFYFGWTFSEAEAVKSINQTIEEISKRLHL